MATIDVDISIFDDDELYDELLDRVTRIRRTYERRRRTEGKRIADDTIRVSENVHGLYLVLREILADDDDTPKSVSKSLVDQMKHKLLVRASEQLSLQQLEALLLPNLKP
jgi:hypothetical protein